MVDLTTNSLVFDAYLQACSYSSKNTLCLNYALVKIKHASNLRQLPLGSNEAKLLEATLKFQDGQFKEATELGEILCTSQLGYFNRKGVGLVSHSYFRQSELQVAVVFTANAYVKNQHVFPFLPLEQLFQAIRPGTDEWDEISRCIEFPIFLDAYVKHIDLVGETERRFAYEDFLLNNGMSRPSELKDKYNEFERGKLIYYLNNICIEVNMDTSTAFTGGSKEIIAERIEICKLLKEIDFSRQDKYHSELNDLIRKQIIINRRQEVDQSRIYIDLPSVKQWVTNNYEESYDRYIAYLRHGLDFEDQEGKNRKKKNQADFGALPSILIPEDEVVALLTYMVDEIVIAYLSPEFGLDRFLSTRIRHGILEGHLRKPLAIHNLITKREYKLGPYLSNDYWINKVAPLDRMRAKELDKIFSTFSSAYDNLILKITSEWLQITSKKKPKGLFDFTISSEAISKIAEAVTATTTFQEFIDYVIQVLEGVLIFRLAKIREEFHGKAKPEAKLLLKNLNEKILTSPTLMNTGELLSEINQARTDMQAQFDKIIEWFIPSSSGNSSPFLLDEPIRVAETFIVDTFPNFKINLSAEGHEDFTIHGNLPIFVDVYINIFENVVKRSGLEIPIADCNIWIDKSDNEINLVYFKVSNDLNLERPISDLEAELKRKKELLESGDYSQYIAEEGNSGLIKIHQSISQFRVVGFENKKATMDFGLENNRYQLTICVPFRVWSLEPEEQDLNK
jgi:hypothetical protein